MHSKNINQYKKFGYTFSLCFPFLFCFILPIVFRHDFKIWPIFLGLFFLIISFLKPSLLKYPYKFWIGLGNILGWINSRIILGFVFVFILIPTSFMMRLFGLKIIKKIEKNNTSYREHKKDHIITFERIF